MSLKIKRLFVDRFGLRDWVVISPIILVTAFMVLCILMAHAAGEQVDSSGMIILMPQPDGSLMPMYTP